jgi:dolichol-phosphate mannosyltransferase
VALLAGLDSIFSDAAVFIPCDQKISPDLIIEMLQYARDEADVIIGERKNRKSNFFNKIFSKLFYSSFNFLGGIKLPKGGTDFVLMTRGPMNFLRENMEYDINVFMLLLWPGFKSKAVEYDSPPRQAGKSKWTMRKRIRLALDSFFGFSLVPLRMITFVGLFLSTTSFLFIVYTVTLYFTIGTPVPGIPTIVTTIAFGFGITFLGLGIIAEYLLRNLNFSRKRPFFVVEEKKISDNLRKLK